jgi:hypothetical protein
LPPTFTRPNARGAAPATEDELESDNGEVEGPHYAIEKLDPPTPFHPPPSPEPAHPQMYVFTDAQFQEVRNVVQSIIRYYDEDYNVNSFNVEEFWY